MTNFYSSRKIRLAFGIPFENIGFHELMPAFNDLVSSEFSQCILAATSDYVIRTIKNPLQSFEFCDFYIPCDTELIEMARKNGTPLELPARYEDFAEQVIRICAHNGHTIFNIASGPIFLEWLDNPEKFLVQDELFTNFIIENKILTKNERKTILHSISEHRPNVILIHADYDIIQDLSPDIMEHSRGSLLVCFPKKSNSNWLSTIRKKIDIKNILMSEKNIKKIFSNVAFDCTSSALRFVGSKTGSSIKFSGMIDSKMLPAIARFEKKIMKRQTDLKIDMSEAVDISLDGIEALLNISRKLNISGKKVTLTDTNASITNKFYEAGISAYFSGLQGIPEIEYTAD
ncbi:hypothetical protein [Maridesulfovibrio bastinii]|uniref:hypothetical protein n=1 Tax=Maridesulfovibrio bastinii TaxID=47157 RepID=UPI00047FF176|nr:hypothetical protein [Maridesulfovibrio bastinii]